jgi:predicted O-methyltransferase YrrM
LFIAAEVARCYEEDLQLFLQYILKNSYHTIVNLGSAEGYYTVGLARHFQGTGTKVLSFEINAHIRGMCEQMCRLNGVASKVELFGKCNPEDLDGHLHGRSLVICDCEGAELELLNPALTPRLAACDILVELHDIYNPKITETMLSRFSNTHQITIVRSQERRAGAYGQLNSLGLSNPQSILSNCYVPEIQWACMVPRLFPSSR